MSEQPSAAQLQAWEQEHTSYVSHGRRTLCEACVVTWPCPVVQLLAALRAAREPRDLERAVVETAVTAVTAWRAMHDERTSVDQWWDVYVEKRDALIDTVDALLAARGGGDDA